MDKLPAIADMDYWTFIDTTANTLKEREMSLDVESLRLIMAFLTTADAMRYDLKASMREDTGETSPALNLMSTLDIGGEMALAEAAALSNMSRAAASSMVDRLVRAKYAVRRPSQSDRRSVLVSLTDAGRDAVLAIRRGYNKREVVWLSVLTPAERSTLHALLEKMMVRHLDDEDSLGRS